MMSTEVSAYRTALNGAALLLLWLLIAGALLALEGGLAWAALVAAVVGFVAVHGVAGLPRSVERSRLGAPRWLPFLAYAVPISLLLVAGDVLWLISLGRASNESGPEPQVVLAAFVLLFPLFEEFGFRLWIQTPLERRMPPLLAVVLVAVVFSLLHSADFPLPQFIAGVAFGVALIVTGSIWASVLMHLVQNLLLICLGSVPQVQLWATELTAEPPPGLVWLVALCWLLALILAITWFRTEPRFETTNRKGND